MTEKQKVIDVFNDLMNNLYTDRDNYSRGWIIGKAKELFREVLQEHELIHKVKEEKKYTIKYKCLLCGRDNFDRKEAHNCFGGFRKHGLKWNRVLIEKK